MKVQTRDFGEVEISQSEVLEFTQPPFGFEEYHRFVLLRDSAVGEGIAWLQSLEEATLCFILVDPSGIGADFQPQLPPQTDSLLGEGELHCWVVGVVPADFRETTVNLKSPIFINPQTRRGAQMILDQDYSVRYSLIKGEG